MPPNQSLSLGVLSIDEEQQLRNDGRIRCAILGTGMMGQEHVSYLLGYSHHARIDFLCDPHRPSLDKALEVYQEFAQDEHRPRLLDSEDDLVKNVDEIDLLVIASPNYRHTEQLLRFGKYNLTILVEKPVAVNPQQLVQLQDLLSTCQARIWVAMEYRFMPAIHKLLQLLPEIGDVKMVTIRENRYPFLHKIGNWNRDHLKTGDTLVEKASHFFDLFRLITGGEAGLDQVRSMVQRGINYAEEPAVEHPIIDSAYVMMPFQNGKTSTMACLELCMYAEGSRHQEEIIVTGTKGRLEAYLPENKVYQYQRPSHETWKDRSVPPPPESIVESIHDCSDVKDVHGIESDIPTHAGYHYSSTAIEWYYLVRAMAVHKLTGVWKPKVSLEDGMRAVQIGIQATLAIVKDPAPTPTSCDLMSTTTKDTETESEGSSVATVPISI